MYRSNNLTQFLPFARVVTRQQMGMRIELNMRFSPGGRLKSRLPHVGRVFKTTLVRTFVSCNYRPTIASPRAKHRAGEEEGKWELTPRTATASCRIIYLCTSMFILNMMAAIQRGQLVCREKTNKHSPVIGAMVKRGGL